MTPRQEKTQAQLGFDMLDRGQAQEAAAAAAGILVSNPEEIDAWLLLGEARWELAGPEEALHVLEQALHSCGDHPRLLVARAGLLLDAFDGLDEARTDIERALARDLRPDERFDATLLYAEIALRFGDPEAALIEAEHARRLDPSAAQPHFLAAQAHFDRHAFDLALKAVARAVDRDVRHADAFFLRGEILEAGGDASAAEAAFGRARQLDPERFAEPPDVSLEDFEKMVGQALEHLPERVRAYLDNVAVMVDESPDLEQLRAFDPVLSPACMGLFEGTPRPFESTADPWSSLPRTVRLFRRNIVRGCGSAAEVAEAVRTTLIHELGHYLGLDEEDLIARGLQ